jgi:outer membrane murein-binding lipoprotein Lpp
VETVTWTDDKIDLLAGNVEVLDGKVDTLTTRVDVLDGKVDVLTTRVDVLDGKVDVLTTRVDLLDGRVAVLDKKVDVGFARLEGRMDLESARTDERFNSVNHQLGELRIGQTELTDRFDAMQRTLVQIGFGLAVGLLAALVALIGVIVTLLVTQ